jgi:hypothetical protein
MFKKLIEEAEKVRGGLSDNMTVEQIAEKHGVSVETIEMQIKKGKEIEMEHTDDEKEAIKVTMDHLVEIPDYYDRLIKMEKDAEEELKENFLENQDSSLINWFLNSISKYFGTSYNNQEIKTVIDDTLKISPGFLDKIMKLKKLDMKYPRDKKDRENMEFLIDSLRISINRILKQKNIEIPAESQKDFLGNVASIFEEEKLHEAMLLLTEAEKEIKNELQKARDFFGGKKVEGIDTNRFVRLWNMIRDNFKMELKVFLKLLNPLNWPKAIFMNFYNITKSIATLGTRENESLKIETQRFLKDIADGKYKGKSAKDMFTDYNEIRKEYGFKPYTFLQENVIRTDFNGELNRDFDGSVIDSLLEIEIRKNILDKFTSKVVLNINSLPNSDESYIFEIESNDDINPNDSIEIYAVIRPRLKEILPLSRIFNTEKDEFDKEFNLVIRTWFEKCWNLSNKSEKKYSLKWHDFEKI